MMYGTQALSPTIAGKLNHPRSVEDSVLLTMDYKHKDSAWQPSLSS